VLVPRVPAGVPVPHDERPTPSLKEYIVAEYPTINEPREDVTYLRPDPVGPRIPPPWARSESYARWGMSAVYLAAMTGLASTFGTAVAPWLGWMVLMLCSGIPALIFWIKHNDHEADRVRLASGPGPGAGQRFTGGTSLGVGPGRDAPHPHPDESDEDSTYP
jgi:hypothetical protein